MNETNAEKKAWQLQKTNKLPSQTFGSRLEPGTSGLEQFLNISFGNAEEMLKWRVRITKVLQAKKIYINKNSLCQCAIYFDKSMSLSVFLSDY